MPDQQAAAPQWTDRDWVNWLAAVGLDHHGGRSEAARRLGISREHMSRLIAGRAWSSLPLERLAAILTKVPPNGL